MWVRTQGYNVKLLLFKNLQFSRDIADSKMKVWLCKKAVTSKKKTGIKRKSKHWLIKYGAVKKGRGREEVEEEMLRANNNPSVWFLLRGQPCTSSIILHRDSNTQVHTHTNTFFCFSHTLNTSCTCLLVHLRKTPKTPLFLSLVKQWL